VYIIVTVISGVQIYKFSHID